MRKLKTVAVVSLLMVPLLIYPAIAQTTTISIENISVPPGGSKTVPIYIYNVTDPAGVGAVQLNLSYNSSVVQVTSTDSSSSDLVLVTPSVNNTLGLMKVGAGWYVGCGKPLPTGNVRVLDVTFKAVGKAGDQSVLDIRNTTLKNSTLQGTIAHTVTDGVFQITETQNAVYLNPTNSSTNYGRTREVELRVNASNFQGGYIKLLYNASCANVTQWQQNNALFSALGAWDSEVPGQEIITFGAESNLTGDFLIGTLGVRCVCECECETLLDFDAASALYAASGEEVIANWRGGSFGCIKGLCGDVAPYPGGNGEVNMGDVIRLLNYVNHPGDYPVDEWSGNVNCANAVIDMGDVVLLLNNVTYSGRYPLNCCD